MKPFLFLCLMGLTACTTTQTTPPINPSPIAIPKVDRLYLDEVEWQVYMTSDLEDLIESLREHPDDDFLLIALDGENYETLMTNLVKIRRAITQQKDIIESLSRTMKARSESEPDA